MIGAEGCPVRMISLVCVFTRCACQEWDGGYSLIDGYRKERFYLRSGLRYTGAYTGLRGARLRKSESTSSPATAAPRVNVNPAPGSFCTNKQQNTRSVLHEFVIAIRTIARRGAWRNAQLRMSGALIRATPHTRANLRSVFRTGM